MLVGKNATREEYIIRFKNLVFVSDVNGTTTEVKLCCMVYRVAGSRKQFGICLLINVA